MRSVDEEALYEETVRGVRSPNSDLHDDGMMVELGESGI